MTGIRSVSLSQTTLLLILALITLGGLGCGTADAPDSECARAVWEDFNQRYPALQGGIGQQLGVWIEALGEPQTIEQADLGSTYFYWPTEGLAAFAHPLYRSQYRRLPRVEQVVTSIVLPLRRRVHPRVPPVSSGLFVDFDQPSPVSIGGRPLARLSSTALLQRLPCEPSHGSDAADGEAAIRFRRGFLSDKEIILHLDEGEPSEIEIRESWFLSDYD